MHSHHNVNVSSYKNSERRRLVRLGGRGLLLLLLGGRLLLLLLDVLDGRVLVLGADLDGGLGFGPGRGVSGARRWGTE